MSSISNIPNPTILSTQYGAIHIILTEKNYRRIFTSMPLTANERHKFISSHHGLVIFIALRYARSGISINELISEGQIGLIAAADRFNPSLGFRFSSYAVYWIRQKIRLLVLDQPPPMLSLDEPISPETTITLGDLIEDPSPPPCDQAALSELRSRVRSALEGIPPDEKRIIELKYGILDGREKTFDEIGKLFGLTRQRCHQICRQGIECLRHELIDLQ